MTIQVCKAEPIGSEHVSSVSINVCKLQPRYSTVEDAAVFFNREADTLEAALYRSLPGGTYDRLLGKMLSRKASHFRVAHTA